MNLGRFGARVVASWGFLAAVALAAPPSNDECSNSTDLQWGVPMPGSNVDATDSGVTRCATTDNLDIWFFFRGGARPVNVSTCGSAIDTTVAIYEGCPGTQIACSDAAESCGETTSAELSNVSVVNGLDYFVRVAGVGSATGDISVLLTEVPLTPPANDDCANAAVLQADVMATGTNAGATDSGAARCTGDDDLDVWFKYTPAVDETVDISTCGSDFDTTLSVFDSCGGASLDCNNEGGCGPSGASRLFCFAMTAGQEYFIRIAGYGGAEGNYKLQLSPSTCTPPPNDDCPNAIPLTLGIPATGTTAYATGTDISSCSDFDAYDVWYSYTPAANETVDFVTCGSSIDTTLSVFDSCGGAELACNDDASVCGYSARVDAFAVTGGTTYLLRLAAWQGMRGDYVISVVPSGNPYVTYLQPDHFERSNDSTVSFFVGFDQDVQGFDDANDVSLNAVGLTYSGINISGDGRNYMVHVTGLSGDGSLAISVNTASDVRSLSDVPLAYSLVSPLVLIDTVGPSFADLVVSPDHAGTGETVTITFTSSDAVDDQVDVLVNGNSATRGAKSPFTFSYTIQETDLPGPAFVEVSGYDDLDNYDEITSTTALQIVPPAPPVPVAGWPLALILPLAAMLYLRRRPQQKLH